MPENRGLKALEGLKVLPCDGAGFEKVIKELIPANRVTANLDAFDQGKNSIREL